jgi:L-lactate dehydrogenase complex protein LldG
MPLSAKENILSKIKKALEIPVPLPFPAINMQETIYPAPSENLKTIFSTVFTGLLGNFQHCNDDENMVQTFITLAIKNCWHEVYCAEPRLRNIFSASGCISFSEKNLVDADVAITSCEALIARTGSILLSAAIPEGRTASVYAPVHVCVAYTNQLVFDGIDALQSIQKKYNNQLPSMLCFATGPSRTADIEKTLVVGVHGPKEVYCLLIDQ